jgi:signal transduction histidine kinase
MSTSLNLIESNFWTRYGAGVGWILDLVILMIVFSNQIRQSFLKNIQLKQELNESKITAAKALLTGQIEERQRLSSELHDGISIQMALMKMRLDNLFSNKTIEEMEIIKEMNKISSDIRNFTHAISPFNLNTQTLEDAIEDLIYKIENQTDLEIDLETNHFDEVLLNDNQKHSLFQTLQELLNNTIKYGLATKVLVNLHSESKNIRLRFQDNGQGFDINTVKKGIGLNNIQARADLLNGNFEINSNQHGSQFEFSFEV